MSLLFVFVFALKGVLFPSKDITLTHKHGNVKTPAQKTLTLEGKIKLLMPTKKENKVVDSLQKCLTSVKWQPQIS